MRHPAWLAAAVVFAAGSAHAQCRSADRPVTMSLGIAGGQVQALVTRRIPVCVRHEFKLQVKAGQRIELALTSPSGQKGMLTLVAPSGDKPADGQNEWSGTAAESGDYVIEVGTDRATTYTLRVSLR
jgi:hypothetical protein